MWRNYFSFFLAVLLLIAPGMPGQPVMAAPVTTVTTFFSNANGWVRVSNSPALNPVGAVTIEAWVKRSGLHCETVVGKNYNTGYWLGFCDNTIRFYGPGGSRDGNATVGAGEWHHIAVTFDGNTRRYYLDGMLDATHVTPGEIGINELPLMIGADPSGAPANFKFRGSLADVRLWRTARTQAEIRANLNQLLEVRDPDLVGYWRLEGGADEAFRRHTSTGNGTIVWNGGSAPPVRHAPIEIPRMAAVPVVDGTCSATEYPDLRMPIWTAAAYASADLTYAYAGATADHVYVCIPFMRRSMGFASLYLDPNNSGGSFAGNDDYALAAKSSGSELTRGTGTGGYTAGGMLADALAMFCSSCETYTHYEFRFARSEINGAGSRFRMGVMLNWLNNAPGIDNGFPAAMFYDSPNTWSEYVVNDNLMPRADAANPTVRMLRSPSNAQRGQNIVFGAIANDDIDLERIELFVDNAVIPVHTCVLSGDADTAGSCAHTAVLPVGMHMFYATAYDHRGRLGVTYRERFLVAVDGAAPQLTARHFPQAPNLGQPVDIVISASDPSGIQSVLVNAQPMTSLSCPLNGTPTVVNCTLRLTPQPGMRLAHYSITARDNEGFETQLPAVPVIWGNSGPDSDNDWISDDIERLLGTNPNNPDTDGDALPDGWEVFGLQFPAVPVGPFSERPFVNLPALGANPRQRDIFVQYDHERGARAEPTVWPAVINLFRDNGIALHVTMNERPRPTGGFFWPTTGVTSTLGAEEVAARVDGNGRNYFPPELAWTHHYIYSNHSTGASGAWHFVTLNVNTNNCPLNVSDPQNDTACRTALDRNGNVMQIRSESDQMYRIVHELGHSLGMGHGGIKVSRTLRRLGGSVFYDGEGPTWENENFKPNYLSEMNYRYTYRGGQYCINPADGSQMLGSGYARRAWPLLNESALSESPLASFQNQIDSAACPGLPGFKQLFEYTCVRPGPITYTMVSDGRRTVSRQADGGARENIGFTNASGVDWNCDGNIQPGTVSQDTNLAGGLGTLTTTDDWRMVPMSAGKAGYILNLPNDPIGPPADTRRLRGDLLPNAYVARMGPANGNFPRPSSGPLTREAALLTDVISAMPDDMQLVAELGEDAARELALATWVQRTGSSQLTHVKMRSGIDLSMVAGTVRQMAQRAEADPPLHDDNNAPPAPIENAEFCNGLDDDGDGLIDEFCPDTDADGVPDAFDVCPATADPDQAATDGSGLGDACARPRVGNLRFTNIFTASGALALAWDVAGGDDSGATVYRQCGAERELQLVATVSGNSHSDSGLPTVSCRYLVRALNRLGAEGDAAVINNGLLSWRAFVPALRRN